MNRGLFTSFRSGDVGTRLYADRDGIDELIDVSAHYSVAVKLTAQAALATGQMSWLFKLVDPQTGGEPGDSLLGFLPPNDSTGRGEGYVIFSAQPRGNATPGAAFNQRARIVFDDNAPIDTNVYVNTLNKDAPSCVVKPLPVASPILFSVSWNSSDVGSGVASHDVYSSADGGPWLLWQSAVTGTQATFAGSKSSTYGFTCTATDSVGLWQPPADQTQATTQASLTSIYLPLARR